MSHVELGPTNSETHLRNWVQVLMSCKAVLGPGCLRRLNVSVAAQKSWFESQLCKLKHLSNGGGWVSGQLLFAVVREAVKQHQV